MSRLPSRLRDHWEKSSKAFVARRQRRARAGRSTEADQAAFELTPFGRRRKRVGRSSLMFGVGALTAAGCLAWFLL